MAIDSFKMYINSICDCMRYKMRNKTAILRLNSNQRIIGCINNRVVCTDLRKESSYSKRQWTAGIFADKECDRSVSRNDFKCSMEKFNPTGFQHRQNSGEYRYSAFLQILVQRNPKIAQQRSKHLRDNSQNFHSSHHNSQINDEEREYGQQP